MNIKKYLFTGLVLATLASCEKYLEPKVTSQFGNETTWTNPLYAMGVLAEAYNATNQVVCGYNTNNYLDAVTDNSLTTDAASTLFQYVFGSQTMHSDPIANWGTAYNNIAITNLFLEKGLSPDVVYNIADPVLSQKLRNRSMGEAYFLRAWWQMELLRTYGGRSADGRALGYVIVTRTYSENEREEANSIPRSDFELCARQIMADCDTAFKYLPLQYDMFTDDSKPYGVTDVGRASGKAALALKSRVALLAASPAYQPTGGYAISADSIRAKWLRAAVVAQEALDKGQMGALTTTVPLENAMIVGNDLSTTGTTGTALPANVQNIYNEILFRRFANNRTPEQHHFPPMWFGNGKCNPSQNLVNAYPMANGYPITDPRSGYNPQDPYMGRDGRFARQINYNGDKFLAIATERPMEMYASAADGSIGRDAPGFDYRNTWTGYYIRKGMSLKTTIIYNSNNPGTTANDQHLNPLLRRMEVWMNLAEACNEYAGPTGAVPGVAAANTPVAIIKRVRTLYGTGNGYVDEVAGKGTEAFRELILNERRLEFAFENMRLWDIRRWRLPQLKESILGIRIYKDDANKFVYFGTNPGVDDIVVQTRQLNDDKYYTSPLPYGEIVKNKNLIQNAGW